MDGTKYQDTIAEDIEDSAGSGIVDDEDYYLYSCDGCSCEVVFTRSTRGLHEVYTRSTRGLHIPHNLM